MQGLVVVGLIFEEIPNINIKCVSHWSAKYRSRSTGQSTCQVSTSRRRTIQGLVVEGLTVEDIWKGDVKGVKVNGERNIGQGHCLTYICAPVSKSLQPKYRSRSPGQGICRVSTLRRSTLQGLMVVGLTVEEISNVDANVSKSLECKI